MLKQSVFFDKIKKAKLTIQQYHYLYSLYNNPKIQLPENLRGKMPEIYITTDGFLTDKAKSLIKQVEALFKPVKSLNDMKSLGDDFAEKVKEYILLFPSGILPNGKYARGDEKGITNNFIWFFQEYQFTWETILKATRMYVVEFKQKDYLHMRTAMYFVRKIQGSQTICDLATYCDAVNNRVESNDDDEQEETTLGRVV
jgi:hypothetical protein